MALMISVNVYDFSTTGNQYAKKQLVGLPTAGLFVETATSPDPRVYVYSRLRYPALGIADPAYLTAETVTQIIAKVVA